MAVSGCQISIPCPKCRSWMNEYPDGWECPKCHRILMHYGYKWRWRCSKKHWHKYEITARICNRVHYVVMFVKNVLREIVNSFNMNTRF